MMEENGSCVPELDIVVNEKDINGGALEILKVIRPDWPHESINFKLLTDGITNKLVACLPADYPDADTVLVRIYGNKTDMIIDRTAEKRNITLLNKRGLAPNLYATFQNGLAYRFVPGYTLNADTVQNPEFYNLVARRMAKLHNVQTEDAEIPTSNIWVKIKQFLNLVPDTFSNEKNQFRSVELHIPLKIEIANEIEYLQNILEQLGSPIVFCHNDLLLGNVVYSDNIKDVVFIDFEYAGFNYQAYDIANHFTEFMGIDVEKMEYEKFPSKSYQYDWLREYLKEYTGKNPCANEIETLYGQVNEFVLLTHIFWGVWALIQAEHSYINFDFVKYASIRFKKYFIKRNRVLH